MHAPGVCSLLLAVLGACGSKPATPVPASGSGSSIAATPPATWPIPTGWKHETIPFPLGFAPGISHRGVEELRFAPGMFDPKSGGYWSYAFVWRTEDPATLAAPILQAELTIYFRGLLAAVDETKKQIKNPDDIWVKVTGAGEGETKLAIAAQLVDAFGDARKVELGGWAIRKPCGEGAVWVFVMAPETTTVRAPLDLLGDQAGCKQTLPPDTTP
jgi:hypothetical protein